MLKICRNYLCLPWKIDAVSCNWYITLTALKWRMKSIGTLRMLKEGLVESSHHISYVFHFYGWLALQYSVASCFSTSYIVAVPSWWICYRMRHDLPHVIRFPYETDRRRLMNILRLRLILNSVPVRETFCRVFFESSTFIFLTFCDDRFNVLMMLVIDPVEERSQRAMT